MLMLIPPLSLFRSIPYLSSVVLFFFFISTDEAMEQITGWSSNQLILLSYPIMLSPHFALSCWDRYVNESGEWKPAGHRFEWSHYGAALSLIIIKICVYVGWTYETLPPLLLAFFFAFLLQFLAANIGTEHKEAPQFKICSKPTSIIPEALITITYLIIAAYISYHLPLPMFVPKDAECLNPWVCRKGSGDEVKRGLRERFFSICIISTWIYYKAYKMFRSKKLILETLDPETLRMKKQVLVRRGWLWEPKKRQNLELEDADKKND